MGIKLPSEPPESLGTWQSLQERTGVRPGLQTVVLVENGSISSPLSQLRHTPSTEIEESGKT